MYAILFLLAIGSLLVFVFGGTKARDWLGGGISDIFASAALYNIIDWDAYVEWLLGSQMGLVYLASVAVLLFVVLWNVVKTGGYTAVR